MCQEGNKQNSAHILSSMSLLFSKFSCIEESKSQILTFALKVIMVAPSLTFK